MKASISGFTQALAGVSVILALVFSATYSSADETCQSPYMAKIEGQEDFVYVWTLGVEGLGDGQDKLVTVAVNPASPDYRKVVHSLSARTANSGGCPNMQRTRVFLALTIYLCEV